MNEMTLISTHRIRDSSTGDLRLSMPLLSNKCSPQYTIFRSEQRRNICFLLPECHLERGQTREPRQYRLTTLTTTQSKTNATRALASIPMAIDMV